MARSLVSWFAVLGRPGPLVVGAIAVLLTAGCGSSGPSGSGPSAGSTPATSNIAASSAPSSAPAPAGVDACSLVSASEASAAVGGGVRDPIALSRNAASTAAQCDYVGLDPLTNSNTTVDVTVRTTTPAEFAARCANNGTAFPGIGDAACGGPKFFAFLKGTTEVDLTATTTLGAGQVTMNFSVLAKTILTRL